MNAQVHLQRPGVSFELQRMLRWQVAKLTTVLNDEGEVKCSKSNVSIIHGFLDARFPRLTLSRLRRLYLGGDRLHRSLLLLTL